MWKAITNKERKDFITDRYYDNVIVSGMSINFAAGVLFNFPILNTRDYYSSAAFPMLMTTEFFYNSWGGESFRGVISQVFSLRKRKCP